MCIKARKLTHPIFEPFGGLSDSLVEVPRFEQLKRV